MKPNTPQSTEALLGPLNDWEAKNAPEFLYTQGDTSLLRFIPRVSIIGTRKPTKPGIQRANNLAHLLVQNDVLVVSGLAAGIDHTAHTSAMAAGGRTIAVIGTPLERAYPAAHRELQQTIARDHLLVSQFAPGSETFPSCFPKRNRTMALISHATVIIEAGTKSGCISQGWEALRLGRSLFLTRSLVDNPDINWTVKFLDHGAMILDSVEDLLDTLPTQTPPSQDTNPGIFCAFG